ncbi:MAG: PIN domain-containing protein [Nitrospirota bacterium]
MTGHPEALKCPVLIDTSAWICYFARKGFEKLKETIFNLLDENRAAISGPILVELVQGCRTDVEKENLKEVFEGVLWYMVTNEMWHHAADMGFNLRRKGVTVSGVDALIATIAIDNNIPLLHNDNDFDNISKHTKLRNFASPLLFRQPNK